MADIGPFSYFICGGFGGICTVLVGHPFDTVKVRLQTIALRAEENITYKSSADCVKKTFYNEGLRGFYKGMAAPLLGVAPIFAISFMGYRVGKEIFGTSSHKEFSYMQHFFAGAFSGIFTTSIMAPGERIKCLLQVQSDVSPKLYSGPWDCARKLFRDGGIRSLYRGAGATMLRDVPASGLYFLTYERFRDYLTEHGTKQVSISGTVFAGGMAGIANWLIGMPFDVLKSRLQTAPDGLYANGIRDAATHLIETEGLVALYKGMVPVLLRAFPANAACFLGFELCRSFFVMITPTLPDIH